MNISCIMNNSLWSFDGVSVHHACVHAMFRVVVNSVQHDDVIKHHALSNHTALLDLSWSGLV